MRLLFTTLLPVLMLASLANAEKILVLETPQESLDARVELIMNAKKTIDVQYFTVEHDYISISGLALLREAARRDVKVRVIVDSMHNLMTREMMGAFLDNLDPKAQKNIEIKEFNTFNIFKPLCYTRRMHDKSLIIDGQFLIVGDRNVANGYYDIPDVQNGVQLPSFEGTDVLLSGTKSINEAQRYFDERWKSRDVTSVQLYEYSDTQLDYSYCNYRYPDDTSACEMRRQDAVKKIKSEILQLDTAYARTTLNYAEKLRLSPTAKSLETAYESNDVTFIHDDANRRVCKGKNPELNIGKTLYETIAAETKHDLIIVTPYLIVTPEMENLIRHLVIDKGVLVRFLTNSTESNDVAGATAGYLKTRNRLMSIKNPKTGNGVRIYEFFNISNPTLHNLQGEVIQQGKTLDTVHAKIVLMDSKKAFIGSYNWDYRSQNLNSEVGVLIGLLGLKTEPTKEIRHRLAELLTTAKLVRADGTVNDEQKIKTQMTTKERATIDGIIAARAKNAKLWQLILELPLNFINQL